MIATLDRARALLKDGRYDEAAAAATAAPSERDRAGGLELLAEIAEKRGDDAAAERHARDAVALCDALPRDDVRRARSANVLGRVLQSRGALDEAAALFERALVIRRAA